MNTFEECRTSDIREAYLSHKYWTLNADELMKDFPDLDRSLVDYYFKKLDDACGRDLAKH